MYLKKSHAKVAVIKLHKKVLPNKQRCHCSIVDRFYSPSSMQSVVAIVPCRNSIVVKGGKQAKNSDMHVAIMNWMWCYDESSLPFPPSCLLSFFFISV